MILLFLDKYYVTNSEEVITCYGIMKDFIIPSVILIATIIGSIIVFNYGFRKEKKHDELLDKKEDEVILKIIKLTNNKIIKEINKTVEIVEKNTTNLCFKGFSEFYQTKFNKDLNHFLLEIGLKKIFTLHVIERNLAEDSFVKYWESVHQLPGYLSAIENYDLYIATEYNRLNKDINQKLHEILIKTSNYIHDNFPPFETIKINADDLENNPSLKLASILIKFYEDFHKLDSELAMQEKASSFLSNLNTIKEHPIASKAIDSAYAQEIVYALNIIENFYSLFMAGRHSYDYYLTALKNAKINIESYQTEINRILGEN